MKNKTWNALPTERSKERNRIYVLVSAPSGLCRIDALRLESSWVRLWRHARHQDLIDPPPVTGQWTETNIGPV